MAQFILCYLLDILTLDLVVGCYVAVGWVVGWFLFGCGVLPFRDRVVLVGCFWLGALF